VSNINFTSDRVINPQTIFWSEISYQHWQPSCHFKGQRFYQKKANTNLYKLHWEICKSKLCIL